jgi:hypothetical protein
MATAKKTKKTRAATKRVASISEQTLGRPFRGTGYMLVGLDKPQAQFVISADKAGQELANAVFILDSDVVPHHGLRYLAEGESMTLSFSSIASLVMQPSGPALPILRELAQRVNEAVQARRVMLDRILQEDQPIAFDFLPEALSAFCGKTIVITDSNGCRRGVRLDRVRQQRGWGGEFVEFAYETLLWENGRVVPMQGTYNIYHGDPKRLAEYGISLTVSPDEREQLAARGRRVVALNSSCAYVHLQDGIETRAWLRWERDPRSGRGIVDQSGASTFAPELRQHDFEGGLRDVRAVTNPDQRLTDDDMFRVDPYLMVFSFISKAWGRAHVDKVADIRFRMDAFERLVMPERDKRLVFTLVKNTDPSMVTDIVDDKGGGCSLLLHGKPGRGKTLTAEAVAEVLKRPLYVVSVGELGTDPKTLEESLYRVLLTAHRWNAVLLLDEADVFLERRSAGDVNRNAMVSTFLRLLEYYNGVLILTTNRVTTMDEAFFSRMSLALHYRDFEEGARAAVVRNLLDANGVRLSDSEIDEIATSDANGRQIKSAIRLSRFLAREENRAVSAGDIMMLLDRVHEFERAMREGRGDADDALLSSPLTDSVAE